MIRIPRIRCNYCGRRIPASSVVCPNCHRNPRAFYWKPWYSVGLIALGSIVLIALVLIGANQFNPGQNQLVRSNATATPTPTRAPMTIVIVATRAPATTTSTLALPTATPVAPTATRTATARPSATPLPSATATPTPRLVRATSTHTRSPTPSLAAAPQLISPADNTRVEGPGKRVELKFQPAQPLNSQEWYRAKVSFLDRDGNPFDWCGYTRTDSIEFPRNYYEDASPYARSFVWSVLVVRASSLKPETCDAPITISSAQSQVWTFYWY